MDAEKVGRLIARLRREKGWTQKQLAEALQLSDKTVSKWERGQGCPDVSILRALSGLFRIPVEQLLAGDLEANRADGGNMKRLKFFVCPDCGNIVTATGGAEISCCGRKLAPLVERPADEAHTLHTERVEDDEYVTFDHPMQKEHYLCFVASVSYDRVLLVRLYPEQGGEVRFPRLSGRKLVCGCSRDGLWVHKD